jgi:hypothetical protein
MHLLIDLGIAPGRVRRYENVAQFRQRFSLDRNWLPNQQENRALSKRERLTQVAAGSD